MKRHPSDGLVHLPKPKKKRTDDTIAVADADVVGELPDASVETYLVRQEHQQVFYDVLYEGADVSTLYSLYRTCKYMYFEDEYMQYLFGGIQGSTCKEVVKKINDAAEMYDTDFDRFSRIVSLCPRAMGRKRSDLTFPPYADELAGAEDGKRKRLLNKRYQKCPCRWLVYNGFLRLLASLWKYWELEGEKEPCPFYEHCLHAPCNRSKPIPTMNNDRIRRWVAERDLQVDLMCDAVMSENPGAIDFVAKHSKPAVLAIYPYELAIMSCNYEAFRKLTSFRHWSYILRERPFRIDGKGLFSLWLSYCIGVAWWEKKEGRCELGKILASIRNWEGEFEWNEETKERCRKDIVDVSFYISANAHSKDGPCKRLDDRTIPAVHRGVLQRLG